MLYFLLYKMEARSLLITYAKTPSPFPCRYPLLSWLWPWTMVLSHKNKTCRLGKGNQKSAWTRQITDGAQNDEKKISTLTPVRPFTLPSPPVSRYHPVPYILHNGTNKNIWQQLPKPAPVCRNIFFRSCALKDLPGDEMKKYLGKKKSTSTKAAHVYRCIKWAIRYVEKQAILCYPQCRTWLDGE